VSWTKTYAGPEPIRVNKWLAQEGVCSRREAEALIGEGLVSIDGARVDDPGRKLAPGQTLRVADSDAPGPITAVLNKPTGYVSAQPEAGQVPAARLLTRANLTGAAGVAPTKTTSLAPLGRLDQDSRGLLLLSQDGVLAKAVIGADSGLEKEYVVCVEGEISEAKLGKLRRGGLVLDGKPLKPAEIATDGPQRLRFVLREGRKRQIRRMCDLVGLRVTDLLRVRIGPLQLGDLAEGKWRPLTAAERDELVRAAKAAP
jgi:23S rRNA pseudouridine2604 synthase